MTQVIDPSKPRNVSTSINRPWRNPEGDVVNTLFRRFWTCQRIRDASGNGLFVAVNYDGVRLTYRWRVCPSHAANASKLINVGSSAFHHQVAQAILFF